MHFVSLVMHSVILSKASFVTCSAYESEKIRVDQVSEKVHPLVMLVPSLTPVILYGTNLLCNAGKPQSINPLLVFTILYYTLSLVKCALSN
jgi:hypothetical protein